MLVLLKGPNPQSWSLRPLSTACLMDATKPWVACETLVPCILVQLAHYLAFPVQQATTEQKLGFAGLWQHLGQTLSALACCRGAGVLWVSTLEAVRAGRKLGEDLVESTQDESVFLRWGGDKRPVSYLCASSVGSSSSAEHQSESTLKVTVNE